MDFSRVVWGVSSTLLASLPPCFLWGSMRCTRQKGFVSCGKDWNSRSWIFGLYSQRDDAAVTSLQFSKAVLYSAGLNSGSNHFIFPFPILFSTMHNTSSSFQDASAYVTTLNFHWRKGKQVEVNVYRSCHSSTHHLNSCSYCLHLSYCCKDLTMFPITVLPSSRYRLLVATWVHLLPLLLPTSCKVNSFCLLWLFPCVHSVFILV